MLLSLIGFVLASVMIKDEDARETMLARRPSTTPAPVLAD